MSKGRRQVRAPGDQATRDPQAATMMGHAREALKVIRAKGFTAGDPFSEPNDLAPAGRGYWTFATMSIEALLALGPEIGARFKDDSVLWFWTTNFHMRYAYPILDAWGFKATPTILTWGKPQVGRGQRLLGQTEHAIMAIRGRPLVTLARQSTLLLAPIPTPRKLGRKPPEFYALVESLCPAPGYLDIFSRYRHGDKWKSWGAGAPAEEAAK
jgi:N6-adenosine-specific RNA methylase IME4